MPFINDFEMYEPEENENEGDPQYSKFVMDRVKLSRRLDSMDPHDKKILVKIIQFKVLKEVLDAVKNLKGTTADTWRSVMGKLETITGIKIGEDNSGFDFNVMAKTLLPLLGSLAGTMIAFRESQKAESEAASPRIDENDPSAEVITAEIADSELQKSYNELLSKSVVLEMCDNETNGFSLNGR